MSKKPYRFESQEWLELSQRRDWNDSKFNPDDLAEYSEFQRPYALPEGEDNYVTWEFGWPDIDFPDIPPIIVPDPIEDPCSMDGSCTWAKISGPATIQCGKVGSYTQIHVWLGCTVAPWWAAFGSWRLETSQPDEVQLIEGLVIARIVVSDDAEPETVQLTYEGVDNCTDTIEVVITDCDACCDEFALTGDDTVNAGETWTGTINPACAGATCEVASNSGCTLTCNVNEAGSQATVAVGGGDCGTFTVTVTEPDGCEGDSAVKSVRINGGGGSWVRIGGADQVCGACPAGPNTRASGLVACVGRDGFKYGGGTTCQFNNNTEHCYGCTPTQCPEAENTRPDCPAYDGYQTCAEAGTDLSGCPGPTIQGCTRWNYSLCEWKCSC
jgi:hypothetical protein